MTGTLGASGIERGGRGKVDMKWTWGGDGRCQSRREKDVRPDPVFFFFAWDRSFEES